MAKNDTKGKKSKAPANQSAVTALDGHVPPQAIELERAVLGAILLQPGVMGEVAMILKPESFYMRSHETIFRVIWELEANQKPIDMLTVTEELRRTDQLEEVGGAAYIANLTTSVGATANVLYHAHIVAGKSTSRNLISFASEVLTKAYEDSIESEVQMQEAEAALFELSKQNIQQDIRRADSLLEETISEIQEARNVGDGISGISSGFPAIDKMTAGWQKSDLIIVAARPAMGKTAFVLSMAKNMAIDMSIPVAIFNLEMSAKQLIKRLISNVCEIPGEKLKNGQLEAYEWTQLSTKLREIQDKPLYIDDTPSLSVFEFRTKARRLVKEQKVELIIIDYLQLMNAQGMNFGNREQEVSTISRSLKVLAKELDIPIIALSQLNRTLETRQGDSNSKRPQLSDLRESGVIEQDADMVCFIHRPEVYNIKVNPEDNTSTQGMGFFIISKHRNGPIGDVKLIFRGEYTKFAPYDSVNFVTIDSGIGGNFSPIPLDGSSVPF